MARIVFFIFVLGLLYCPLKSEAAQFYLQHEALHTAIIIPAELVYLGAPELQQLELPPADYLRFGWGDAHYYGNYDRHSGAGLTALFLPTAAVMEVTPIAVPRQLPGNVLAIRADPPDIHHLVIAISAWFDRSDPEQEFDLRRTGAEQRRYYRAHGSYHLFNNCNHWTSRQLHFLGISTNRLNSIFAGSLMKRIAEVISPAQTSTQ